MDQQVQYPMIINLNKHRDRITEENDDVQEQTYKTEVSVPPTTTNTENKNIVNLGQFRRNTVDRRIYYRNIKYGDTDDIMVLLREREKLTDASVILNDQLCLLKGFMIQQSLKSGGFSESVELCFDILTNRSFIRKTIKKKKFLANEVKHLCKLNSNYISKILGFCVKSDCFEILQEYCGLNLYVAMNRDYEMINNQLDSLVLQMANAINHCNDLNIFHLDIKPQNICVAVRNNCIVLKLTDFGASKPFNCQFFSDGFTPKYAAPEMHYDACKKYLLINDTNSPRYQEVIEMTQNFCAKYHHLSVSEKCDLFSVGLTCVFIKWNEDPMKLLWPLLRGVVRQPQIKGCLTKLYSLYPNLMKQLVSESWGSMGSLISNLLNGDPSMRWSLDNIFVFLNKLMSKKYHEVNVPCSPQLTVNEVIPVQPTNNGEMDISPNIEKDPSPNVPYLDLLI